jgi:hypothetical protein
MLLDASDLIFSVEMQNARLVFFSLDVPCAACIRM